MSIFAGTDLYRTPTCERCGKVEDDCVCKPEPAKAISPEKQTARLSVEKRKRGKMVTVVRGLADGHPAPHFADLLTKIKNQVGAGGSIQDQQIEIQGDQLERVKKYLLGLGFKVQ
ncbi:translation initiation factor [Mariniblastus sp.]|nr:translation initiation factor [Mariniblastus sp.]